ncbi:MAG TPA: hypothetical protein DCZ94_02555 [Lentisphaeria bacterium]|nr:MAG: hypothetical protein A2X48_21675 [Lentisphaerae bacterium GWF2_49_21]HBC85816.1 hypothetical protein [Lentisphaeria bacterium]
MLRIPLALLSFFFLAAFTTSSQEEMAKTETKPEINIKKVVEAVIPCTVHVEYYFKFDKGEEPIIAGYRCSSCSKFHGTNAGEYVRENRPLEVPGYMISDTELISPDILTQSRFISKIRVTNDKSESPAKISDYIVKQQAVILKLEKNLEGSKPAVLNPEAKAPYFVVGFSVEDGMWQMNTKPLGKDLTYYPEISDFVRKTLPSSMIVTEKGEIVGLSMNPEISSDDSWKCPVSKLEKLTEAQLETTFTRIKEISSKNIVRVQVNFRSPQLKPGAQTGMASRYSGDDDNPAFDTELNTKGIMLDSKKVLVFGDIKPKITARLEGIKVFADGSESGKNADFVCSLNDFAAFIAELKEPIQTKGLEFSKDDILKLRSVLLPAVQIKVYGDKLVSHYLYNRITDFDIGWKNYRFPELPAVSDNLFLFDMEGKLIALPLARRSRLAMDRQSSYSRGERQILPVSYLKKSLDSLDTSKNASNIPLKEKDENRIAWLGVELQQLNPELARMNKVAELTKNGRNGAVVSYLFPDSPAAKAGIKEGDILLCIYLEDDPAPIEVRADEQPYRDFPWAEYDRIPDQYYSRIPTPWQSLDNSIANFLTNVGFGKKFTLEYCSGGKIFTKEFTVEPGPDYFDTTEKSKSDVLGLTVKNLTSEVRRYFQKGKDEPGVIVSKIDPGSKASVAGLKPYEIINQINAKPVNNVKDFEELIKDKQELNLGVSRMAISRTVKIKLANDKDKKPEAGPLAKPDAAKPEVKD